MKLDCTFQTTSLIRLVCLCVWTHVTSEQEGDLIILYIFPDPFKVDSEIFPVPKKCVDVSYVTSLFIRLSCKLNLCAITLNSGGQVKCDKSTSLERKHNQKWSMGILSEQFQDHDKSWKAFVSSCFAGPCHINEWMPVYQQSLKKKNLHKQTKNTHMQTPPKTNTKGKEQSKDPWPNWDQTVYTETSFALFLLTNTKTGKQGDI